MSDRDILERAAKALRTTYDGQRSGSGFTRGRIMATLHARRRRRLTRWFVAGPLLALLLGGSAWAQSTGSWSLVWHSIALVFTPNEPLQVGSQVPEEAAPKAKARVAPPEAATNPTGETAIEEERPAEPELPAELEIREFPEEHETERELTKVAPVVKARPIEAPSSAPEPLPEPVPELPPEPAPDPELAQFRKAHDLHYQSSSPAAAIAAYREYLGAYPSGRFVPEARYNIALDTLKLGRHAEAKRLLAPFAEGKYGSNRQAAAKRLLESLE